MSVLAFVSECFGEVTEFACKLLRDVCGPARKLQNRPKGNRWLEIRGGRDLGYMAR